MPSATPSRPLIARWCYITMPGRNTERIADKLGLKQAREFFADRTYDDNGQLTSRKKTGAVIHDADFAARRVLQTLADRAITTVNGTRLACRNRHHLRARRHPDRCRHGPGGPHSAGEARRCAEAVRRAVKVTQDRSTRAGSVPCVLCGHHDRAGGFAAFEIAVALHGVFQGVGVVDVDLDDALGDDIEQVVGGLEQFGARGGVGDECRARDVERALAGEQAEIEGSIAPGALPNETNRPSGLMQSSDFGKVSLPTLS